MSIYSSLSYREIIKDKIKAAKKAGKKEGVVKIAENTGLHGSFLSSVLSENTHLNEDQLFALTDYLEFTASESEYVQLLHAAERSVNNKRKKKLEIRIEEIQEEQRRTEKHLAAKKANHNSLDFIEYYSDPYYKIIHVFLGIEAFSKNTDTLIEHLSISKKQLNLYLEKLERFGFISRSKTTAKVLNRNFHLSKEAFICKPHQMAMRQLSNYKVNSTEDKKKETVSVTFSGTKKTYENVHLKFLQFLKDCESDVKGAKAEEVFQINFDLFYWS